MRFLDKDIKLVIFDLDGTLIDSTSLWSDIDKKFFAKRNMEIPPLYTQEIAHIGLDKAAILTTSKYLNNKEKPEDIMKEWNDMAIYEYENIIDFKRNGKETLELLKKNNVHIAMATANSKELYEPCLKRLGIDKYLDFIIDVKSCKEGKTSPEIYDKVCSNFNVNRENTMVFEDLLEAMKTAYKAGFLTIGMYDKHTSRDVNECKKNSTLYIDDFETVNKIIREQN